MEQPPLDFKRGFVQNLLLKVKPATNSTPTLHLLDTTTTEDGKLEAVVKKVDVFLEEQAQLVEDNDFTTLAINMIMGLGAEVAAERAATNAGPLLDYDTTTEENSFAAVRKVVSKIKNAQNFIAIDGREGPAQIALMHSSMGKFLFGPQPAPEAYCLNGIQSNQSYFGLNFVLFDGIPEDTIILHRPTENTVQLVYNVNNRLEYQLIIPDRAKALKQTIQFQIKR